MLMLGCFGHFGILSTRQFNFKELDATEYNPELPQNIPNDISIGLWMFIFENIHNYILPKLSRNSFQGKTHKIIYTLLFPRARLFLHGYFF